VIAVGALVLVLVTIAFPFFYEPVRPAKGSVAQGDFMVEPTLRSSCSPEAHRVFYEGRVITKVAGNTIISPRNPSRLLYTVACAHDESQSGIFYFGGGSVAPVQANPLGLYEIGDWIDKYWSPDDRFVIVPSSGHATLVNLQTGRRSAFLGELFERKDAFSSGVSFRGWSPDGKRFAVVISASQMREDRSLDQEFDLVAVDPDTLAPTYVATKRSDDWKNNEFKWAANELAVDAGAPSGSIYHKAR
jgi:hypothetical protein